MDLKLTCQIVLKLPFIYKFTMKLPMRDIVLEIGTENAVFLLELAGEDGALDAYEGAVKEILEVQLVLR